MDGNKGNFLKKRSNPQIKNKGAAKKGKWQNSFLDLSDTDDDSDTMYRILCQSRKIGSVIGKGGNIIKAMREETQAKITIADSVPGSEERVIMILSPSAKEAMRKNEDPTSEKDDNGLQPHCAAQDALLRVHDRIIEEDIGGLEKGDGIEALVMARLLVSNNMVGCLLGRKGDVIQRLRSETGANIRVLSAEHLPACAMSTDELVQIQGKPAIAKKALYEVSTLLHQNPRKDKIPSSFHISHSTQAFHPPGPPIGNLPPLGNPIWSRYNSDSRGIPPAPWAGRYESHLSRFVPGDFDDVPPHGGEGPSDFTMKILCPAGKIGGVIGKGGSNVKQLQLDTGASIHVEDVSAESDERVIRVSSVETLWNSRSQTIDAILQLQNKTSDFSEKGLSITRLLVPSSKVGCLLGQGGQVINEMRRRTQADIRVFSKEEKPKCASTDEELVQISGSIGVSMGALTEIASRLRTRCLRDGNTKAEPAPIHSAPGFAPAGNSRLGSLPSAPMGAGFSGRYELVKGGGTRDYEPLTYPGPPSVMGYPSMRSSMDRKIPQSSLGSVMGTGGSHYSEIPETRLRRLNPGSDYIDMHASAEHLNGLHNDYQSFASSAGQSNSLYNASYQSYNAQQGAYPSISPSPLAYQNLNPQQSPYKTVNTQQTSYHSLSAQASYQY